MEALKLKIFDVLTEKIAVSEFENWLYNSEEFMNQLNSNSFYFDVISINYKTTCWSKNLNKLAIENYDEDFIILYEIEKSCLEIIDSKRANEVYEILSKLIYNFDYDTDYNILWKFYGIYEYFESFEGSMFNKNKLLNEAKFYTKQVIELTQNCINFEETNKALIKDLKPYKIIQKMKNQAFKNKFLAFFKKI
ncbi:hypothetical protein [Thalassobellus citreus]|uniref:hypothetical protein n=1 Tax=Thalassobellus citreus TaxID=3367752 RepID=UPI00378951A6